MFGAPDDPYIDDAVSRDPNACLAPLRETYGVVFRGPDGSCAGVDVPNPFAHDLGKGQAIALTHAAVSQIAIDARRFVNTGAYGVHEDVQGRTVNTMDGPDHRALRRLLEARVFGRRPMEERFAKIVEPTAAFLVDRLKTRLEAGEPSDVRRDLALPLVYRSIAAIIGVPLEEIGYFVKAGETAQAGPREREAAEAAVAELDRFFWRQMEVRKADPQDDMMSILLAAEDGGRRLSDAEIVEHCRFLLPGGIETTWRQAANVFYALLTHPEQFAAVAADPSLTDRAVEEGMRWMPSNFVIPRLAAEDAVISDVLIRTGASVLNVHGAASRDPAVWERPDAFDIGRELKPHLTFDAGAHHCMGHHFARHTARLLVRLSAERLRGLQLACAPDEIGMRGFVIRCPTALPVMLN
jgi:cytochrome P450